VERRFKFGQRQQKEKFVFTLNFSLARPDKLNNGGLNAWPYQGQTKVDGA